MIIDLKKDGKSIIRKPIYKRVRFDEYLNEYVDETFNDEHLPHTGEYEFVIEHAFNEDGSLFMDNSGSLLSRMVQVPIRCKKASYQLTENEFKTYFNSIQYTIIDKFYKCYIIHDYIKERYILNGFLKNNPNQKTTLHLEGGQVLTKVQGHWIEKNQ